MSFCISMASGAVFVLGLQLNHAPFCPPAVVTPQVLQMVAAGVRQYCPSELKRVDAIYSRLVQELGREPFGFELWQAYDAAIGANPIFGRLTPETFCAIRNLNSDGTPREGPLSN